MAYRKRAVAVVCKKCGFYGYEWSEGCGHRESEIDTNYGWSSAERERKEGGHCGLDGKNFKKRPEPAMVAPASKRTALDFVNDWLDPIMAGVFTIILAGLFLILAGLWIELWLR